MTGGAIATIPAQSIPGRSRDSDPLREATVHTDIPEPRLAFDGNPDLISVQLPEGNIPESLRDFNDIQVEAITTEHPQFHSLAGAYIANILHRDNIMGPSFVWPPFKLKEYVSPDEIVFDDDGNMNPNVVSAVIDNYLTTTIEEKGNHLLILHGNKNGEATFIGGGMSFRGVSTEDEGWISKGIVAAEHRGAGLGRALQEARIMHWMLTHPDLNNLNTGVNIDPNYHERDISDDEHELTSGILVEMDIRQSLLVDKPVTAASKKRQLDLLLQLREEQGYPDPFGHSPDGRRELEDALDQLIGPDSFQGFTPDNMRKRKDILVATAKALDIPITATERTFLRAGARYANALPHNAVVRAHPDLLNHTRRLLLNRKYWEQLAPQEIEGLAEYIEEKSAA